MDTISSSSSLLVSKGSQCQCQTQDNCNEKQPFTKRGDSQRRHSDRTNSTAHTSSTAHTFSTSTHTCSTTESLPCTELLITAITQEMIKSMMYAATSGHKMSHQDLQNLLLEKLALGSQTAGNASTSPAMDDSPCSSSNSFAGDSKAPSQSEATSSTTGSSTGNALQEYLSNLTEVTSDSDDSSVVSDISGLTGVFSEHDIKMAKVAAKEQSARVMAANEKRTKQQTVPAPVVARRQGATSFGSVDVRYYERIASDNPSSTSGPSIGIGWNFQERKQLTVDEWEAERASLQRRVFQQLSAKQRTKILLKAGISNKEIVDMIRVNNKTRSQRKSTIDNLSAQKVEEVVEQTKRSLGRLLFGRKQMVVEC